MKKLEPRETFRLWVLRKAGDDARGVVDEDEDMRDWNRRSNGLNDGDGLLKPARDATEGKTLLPGDDMYEPFVVVSLSTGQAGQDGLCFTHLD